MRIILTQAEAENILSKHLKTQFENGTLVDAKVVHDDEQSLLSAYMTDQKLTAIKLIRDATGSGLKEAKDCCEDIFRILDKLKGGGYS